MRVHSIRVIDDHLPFLAVKPAQTIAKIDAVVLYFVSPVDAITDFILGIGYLDDAAVLLLCKEMVRGDLEKYCQWHGGETD